VYGEQGLKLKAVLAAAAAPSVAWNADATLGRCDLRTFSVVAASWDDAAGQLPMRQ